jgi:hypothetical protein
MPGWFKGIKVILEEQGFYPRQDLKLNAKTSSALRVLQPAAVCKGNPKSLDKQLLTRDLAR